ncbi:MAG: DUF1217 domain-containing protein [Hyphomonadaceae bacterium]
MVFRPAIPLSGVAGYNFLQSTLDKQLTAFSDSPQIQNDREYLEEGLAEPISVEDLLRDRRLLRVTLTAFGLAGEETKGGLVRRVLESVADPDDSLLERLNNPDYERFADAFQPDADGNIAISSETIAELASQFETELFEAAVGEVDNDQRLGLNYQSDIATLIGTDSSDTAILFRLLGSVPVRSLLEGALNLPDGFQSLPIERQADELQEQLQSKFGITDLKDLATSENIDRVITRFHAIQSAFRGPDSLTPGAVALTLLTGIGSNASENLFLSRF